MKFDDDRTRDKALVRYQIISPYLALEPCRGQRRATLEKLANKVWTDTDGQPFSVAAETIRAWVRRYRQNGLPGLTDKARPRRGVQCLLPEVIELACQLKREVPERSLDRLLRIMEDTGKVEPGKVRRSTLHRALERAGLSARCARIPDSQDLDRFEAAAANDLWQSDMLVGPWLPDPERPGKVRRAYLYAFLDDHSRLVLHGRWSFKGDLPALELVFRRALQKYGVPKRVYYDNGATYRSGHMRQIVAEIGIHGIIFTKTYRPMGHGKIEALNRYIRSAFIAEVAASSIRTLDQLNEAFIAWMDLEYSRKVHGETHQAPIDRWRADVVHVKYADEAKIRVAFLWKEARKADKAGILSLFGCQYQVGPALARKAVEVRYDPEQLSEIEVWHDGSFVERVRPFEVQPHRRPQLDDDEEEGAPAEPTRAAPPTVDWLNHLKERRRAEGFLEPTPRQAAEQAEKRRNDQDAAVVAALADRVEPAVRDDASALAFARRYGPFDLETSISAIDSVIGREGRDQHVQRYLDAIRRGGGK
ncbi:MAG: DDE-type integrase/transposase/recombinase [Deltaproteobacteria bacterium]|nr:DDE-type integrase/transposase/recombinase [Deltaproteobacteria bacterium]